MKYHESQILRCAWVPFDGKGLVVLVQPLLRSVIADDMQVPQTKVENERGKEMTYRSAPSTWICPKGHIRTIPRGDLPDDIRCPDCGWQEHTKEIVNGKIIEPEPEAPKVKERKRKEKEPVEDESEGLF